MDLESLRLWNTHWSGAPVTERILKHPVARAAVPKWVAELQASADHLWLLRPGPRQVGKTTSLGHVAQALLTRKGTDPRQIVIVPADDPEVLHASVGRLEAILRAAMTQFAPTKTRPLYLLLDEVQELPDWAKQLKSAWDKHHLTVRVLATGSSALQILRPANADFHGRIRTTTVHTMKFREVVEAHPERAARLDDDAWPELRRLIAACRGSIHAGHEETADAFDELHTFLHGRDINAWLQQLWLEYLAWGGYPATRPGCQLDPVARLERFGAAMDTVLARDVSGGGIRKLREFRLLFRGICLSGGGKFEPYSYSKHLGTDGAMIAHWKQILEDTMLVQQLPALKANLRPDKARDKAYPTDPGWISYFAGHTTPIPVQDAVGHAAENVLIDHVRRLQFNLVANTQLPIGYVSNPEIDVAANLGGHWLLLEAKYRAQPHANFGSVGSARDVRIVATRDTWQLNPAPATHYIPAHEFALIC